jgi:GC-rich sequence DNA-binding factor
MLSADSTFRVVTQVPLLDKIEADELQHYRERKGMITTRRQGDDEDDVALFLGVAPASSDDTRIGNGDGEVQEVDEMGRTIGGYGNGPVGPYAGIRKGRRGARSARREARRLRSARGTIIPADDNDDNDGYSTDSTLSPADAEDYDTALHSLLSRAQDLDKDVKAEEFRDPAHPSGGVAYWFSEWRRREPEEYAQAFGGLGCVQAWEYWARKEMVGWEPSRVSSFARGGRWLLSDAACSGSQTPLWTRSSGFTHCMPTRIRNRPPCNKQTHQCPTRTRTTQRNHHWRQKGIWRPPWFLAR